MNCTNFREALHAAALTPAELAHMRSCSACLELAVAADPDNVFRSLGAEVVPPGGIDDFVDGVLQQVHLRQTEQALQGRTRFPVVYRWSIAAMLMIAVMGAALLRDTPEAAAPQVAQAQPVVSNGIVRASLPAIEAYEEANATIVELPAEDTGDLKVVMIFDETLPVDL